MTQKPAEIAYKDFMDGLVALVNSCGLPPFVCALALTNVLTEVNKAADSQYRSAVAEFEKQQEKGGEQVDG